MRSNFSILLVLGVSVGVLGSPPAVAAPPAYCNGEGTIDVRSLPSSATDRAGVRRAQLDRSACALGTRVVVNEGHGVSIPPVGHGAGSSTLRVNGSVTLDIATHERAVIVEYGGGSNAEYSSANVSAPDQCDADNRSDINLRESDVWDWEFYRNSTPSSMTEDAALTQLQQGVSHIAEANNECGRGDNVSARRDYIGNSGGRGADMSSTACDGYDDRDTHNVVEWGSLSDADTQVLAKACYWYVFVTGPDEMVEGDIRFDNTNNWAASIPSCSGAFDVEGIMTHESGHIFGLKDLYGDSAANLTMYGHVDQCSGKYRTLGKGDLNSLETLY